MTDPNKAEKDAENLQWRANERLSDYECLSSSSIDRKPATTTAQLYEAEGREFISLAYLTFLQREPSDTELAYQEERLKAGISKSAIAASIRYSSEGRSLPQQLHLPKAWLAWAPTRIPLLGRFYEWAIAMLGIVRLKRSILSCQQEVISLHNAMDDRTRGLCRDIISNHDELSREIRDEVGAIRDRIRQLQDQLGTAQFRNNTHSDSQDAPVDDGFYIAFEEHFRGSETVIRERLSYYLPILEQHLGEELRSTPMADIGCGRGEWLGLLTEAGYSVTGIDLNKRNIETCRDKGLQAVQEDGIAWLRNTESRSLSLISSFHVIEHVTLAQLTSLLVEALRCLKSGGVLLLETPNPENLITAAHRFYTDPSHRNPIPPDLAEFLLKYAGFIDVTIHRLHPVPEELRITPKDDKLLGALDQLFHGPQDYAAIAIKP